jgi:hypothetical protein
MAEKVKVASLLVAAAFGLAFSSTMTPGFAQQKQGEPFKLGVEQKHEIENAYPAYPSYPPPQMVQPVKPPPVKKPPPPKKLEAKATMAPVEQPVKRPPIQAAIQENVPPGVLPQVFLGTWQVLGQRKSVEAQPQYQQGIGGIFETSNSQVWSINGNPGQGYSMSSNTGVSTSIIIDKVSGNTAFIRYQHPIRNTMAQEAIVMQLSPDGRQFQGMERISIVKQGEPSPRAKVTYTLFGQRQ